MKSQSAIYRENNPRITESFVKYRLIRGIMKTFGEALREQLNAKQMTAAELSRRSGVTKQNIGRLLNNTPHPITGALPKVEQVTVEKLARPLGWNISEALNAAGYASEPQQRPRSIPELIAALERLGIESPMFYHDLPSDPDGEGSVSILIDNHSKPRII